MKQIVAEQLLTSIESDRLVVISGAGLSMAQPSYVPSAAQLAEEAAAKYRLNGGVLPAGSDANLGALAEHFFAHAMLPDFIVKLVNWSPFRRLPNEGHEALADFLACRVVEFCLTTNFDFLVEQAASTMGEPNFQSAITGHELVLPTEHAPYVKIHGCFIKDQIKTLWCADQLTKDPVIAARVGSLSTWLQTHLDGRDVLMVGFWTDWNYLNAVLGGAISTIRPNRVVVVDPASEADLAARSPQLWKWATEDAASFHHEQASGAKFFSELRRLFGKAYFAKLLSGSIITYKTISGGSEPKASPNLSILSHTDLFELRRDSAGLPGGDVPRAKRPDNSMKVLGALHFAFASANAVLDGPRYVVGGKRYRIVQGAGRTLSEVKTAYAQEPPEPISPDVVVCAGALDDVGITSVIRKGIPGGIIRPGTAAKWITADEAFRDLGV